MKTKITHSKGSLKASLALNFGTKIIDQLHTRRFLKFFTNTISKKKTFPKRDLHNVSNIYDVVRAPVAFFNAVFLVYLSLPIFYDLRYEKSPCEIYCT